MALFAGRPEEPTEWAGLPSEPRDRRENDELTDPVPTDLLGLATGEGITSVPVEIPHPDPGTGTGTEAEHAAEDEPATDTGTDTDSIQ